MLSNSRPVAASSPPRPRLKRGIWRSSTYSASSSSYCTGAVRTKKWGCVRQKGVHEKRAQVHRVDCLMERDGQGRLEAPVDQVLMAKAPGGPHSHGQSPTAHTWGIMDACVSPAWPCMTSWAPISLSASATRPRATRCARQGLKVRHHRGR